MTSFRKLWPFLRPFRHRFALALLATCMATGLGALPPLLMGRLVDRVILPRDWDRLAPIVLALLLVPLFSAGLRFLGSRGVMLSAQRILADIRLALYHRILTLGLAYHANRSAGMLVNRLMTDVNQLQHLVSMPTLMLVTDIFTFAFALVVTALLSPKQWILLVIMLALYIAAHRRYSRRIRKASQAYRETVDEISGRLQETIAGVRQVRIYNREEHETERFLEQTARSLEQAQATNVSSVSLNSACAFISGVGSTLIAGLGAWLVVRGELTVGDVVAFTGYVWMAIDPAVRLATVSAQLTETFVSARRVLEILEAKPAVASAPGAPLLPRGPGAVEFRDVTFSYVKHTPLFQELNLSIPAGATVALVGPTGCGKTSLTALLMRHWDVQGGAVRIDGVDVRAAELHSLRRRFGVVLQDPVIFEGTLAENIAYGEPRASSDRIEAAARTAELGSLLRTLPHGLDTRLGSRGARLSVGEKQRVSIARAILKDPAILILDEATSALDSESEALIQKALSRVLRGRTSIVIAHRLSTIAGADRIVVLEHGRILETGTHAELLAAGGLYRKHVEELRGRLKVEVS